MRQSPAVDPKVLPYLAALAGLTAASALWLVSGAGSTPALLGALEAQTSAPSQRTPPARLDALRAGPPQVGPLLFAPPAGAAEVELVLSGIARGPRDQAALISINKAAPTWLGMGQTLNGVTLIELGASKALVDTPLGFKEVSLDQAARGGPPSSTSAPASVSAHLLEPASAPVGRRP